ncbi:MAG: hypothetical protein VKJ64_08835 [Leptolyngbyaceae bacterium]|nr:hypothetical protein [Leptolyngbyaceae bacterium]
MVIALLKGEGRFPDGNAPPTFLVEWDGDRTRPVEKGDRTGGNSPTNHKGIKFLDNPAEF